MLRYLPLLLAVAMQPVQAQSPATAVRVLPLDEVVVDLEREAPAEVLALNDSLLAAEVNAVVAGVAADVGQQVAAGDLLIELDRRDFQLQLDAAEAALSSATARQADAMAKLERARTLGQSKYISADELLNRETALAVSAADIRSAEAQVAIARRQLEKCSVRAPFDGVVRERTAQQGAYMTIGMPLLRLTQTQPVELDAEVPAMLADSLRRADYLEFAANGERWPVRLVRLSPVVEPGRRAQRARFAFSDAAPMAGQNGDLVWRVADGQLPASLISRRDGALGVFVLEDGAARFVPLDQAQEGRPVPVGLPGGTQVIVQGQDRLQHGDAVQVR